MATTRTPRGTAHSVTVGRAEEFGLDPEGQPWLAVCDDHATLIANDTKALAMSSTGLDFCDECQAEAARSVAEAAVKAAGHTVRVHSEGYSGTWAYRCTCGDRDGGYLAGPYARDAWRERNGLSQLTIGLLA